MSLPSRRLPIGLLLVEDSPADSRLLSESLRDLPGAEDAVIRTVRSLADAKAELARFSFTCVLLDLGLPDGRGVGNIQVLREIDRSVAIVVLTGNDDESLASEAIRLGAQDYLVKGQYDADKILRLLRHAIQRNRHVHELEDDRHREFHRATHDALTGLANRDLFDDRLARHLDQARAGRLPFAVCSLDLDGYKAVNDAYGHRAGDDVLVQVSAILKDGISPGDSVARVGGDEFMILLNQGTGADDPADVAHRLRACIQAIDPVGDQAIRMNASIGIARFPEHGDDIALLLERVEQARIEARRSGRGIADYVSNDAVSSERERALRRQLHEVLVDNRFSLLFHPWVDADSRQILRIKLAPRWDGLGGAESAEAFLRGVAQIGCASQLSLHVVGQAFEQCTRWQQQGLLVPPLAFRLGEAELEDAGFIPALQALMVSAGIAFSRVQILIAVTTLTGIRAQRMLEHLERVRAQGFGVVLDAVGPDGEAFKWLTAMPLDGVRLMPRLSRALREESQSAAAQRFITAIQAGATAIGVPVIVSGVDDESERRRLLALGCRCLQGSLFGPVDAADIEMRLSMRAADNLNHDNDRSPAHA